MPRVVCLIDGFNLYHSINENPSLKQFKWLDLQSFAHSFLRSGETLTDLYYFTSLAYWDALKQERHKRYIRVLKDRGIKVVYGKFKAKDAVCRICGKSYTSPEEKRTDVNIAVTLFRLAHEDQFDTALLISGDTDLAPAVEAVVGSFPQKRVGVIFPMNRTNLELEAAALFTVHIKYGRIIGHRLPDSVTLKDGTTITCPPEWM
jgi:uncharacterized LabA/DUF88 family protein